MRWTQAAQIALGDGAWCQAYRERLERAEEKAALVSWCRSLRWTWFVTQTFRGSYSLTAALRLWFRFLAGGALSCPVTVAFSVSERHKSRRFETKVRAAPNVLSPNDLNRISRLRQADSDPTWTPAHVHSLVLMPETNPASRDYRVLKEASFLNLGIARWKPYDHRNGAVRYCAKYLWKRNNSQEREACWGIYPSGGDESWEKTQ